MLLAQPHLLRESVGGARLLSASMADRASASLVLMFSVGARHEDPRIAGASHFIEHLLFKGTARRPTSKDIAEAIEGVGGVINASTDKEVTAYWTRVPAERLELAIDVLVDIVTNSTLAPEDVDRERLVILEELKMYQDQPQDYVHSLFEEIMWPDHALGRDIVGTVESLQTMTRSDLVGYLAQHYGQPRLVAAVAGGIDGDAALSLLAERMTLRSSVMEIEDTLPGPLSSPRVLLHRKDTEQAHICLGTRALSYLDPDRHALDLVNTILGEGMSSRLFLEIRERQGLAYDVHSFTSKHRDSGYLAVYLGVDVKQAERAVEAVLQELRRISEEETPAPELLKVKEYTKGRLRLGLESTNSMASWLAHQQLLHGRVRPVEEVVESVEAVTAADVQRVARKVLDDAVQLAVIGPFKTDAPFRSLIGG